MTRRPPLWDDVADLELETLSWAHWFNHDRASYCDDVPPAEFEAADHAAQQTPRSGLDPDTPSLHQRQGGSVSRGGQSLYRRTLVAFPRIVEPFMMPITRSVSRSGTPTTL